MAHNHIGAAHASRPTAGSPRVRWHFSENTPALSAIDVTSHSQRLCNKTLTLSHLHNREVPDASLLTGAALAGTEPLR
jgi:hypothetical protein